MIHDVKDKQPLPFVYFPLVDMPGLLAIPIGELGLWFIANKEDGSLILGTNRGTFRVVNGVATTYLGD